MKYISRPSCALVLVLVASSLFRCSGGGMDGTGVILAENPGVSPQTGGIPIQTDGIRTGPIFIGSGNINFDYGTFDGELTQSGFTGTFTLPTNVQGIEGQILIGDALEDSGAVVVELEQMTPTIFRIPGLSADQSTLIQDNIRIGNLYGRIVTNARTIVFPFKLPEDF